MKGGAESMSAKLLLTADDVVSLTGVKKPTAYALMRKLNEELNKKGYITVSGKISARYFYERLGITEQDS